MLSRTGTSSSVSALDCGEASSLVWSPSTSPPTATSLSGCVLIDVHECLPHPFLPQTFCQAQLTCCCCLENFDKTVVTCLSPAAGNAFPSRPVFFPSLPPSPPPPPTSLSHKEPSISLDAAQRRATTSVGTICPQDQVSLMVLTLTCGHIVATLDLCLLCAASKLIPGSVFCSSLADVFALCMTPATSTLILSLSCAVYVLILGFVLCSSYADFKLCVVQYI